MACSSLSGGTGGKHSLKDFSENCLERHRVPISPSKPSSCLGCTHSPIIYSKVLRLTARTEGIILLLDAFHSRKLSCKDSLTHSTFLVAVLSLCELELFRPEGSISKNKGKLLIPKTEHCRHSRQRGLSALLESRCPLSTVCEPSRVSGSSCTSAGQFRTKLEPRNT